MRCFIRRSSDQGGNEQSHHWMIPFLEQNTKMQKFARQPLGSIHESEVSLRSAKHFLQYASSLFRWLHSPARPAVQMGLVSISFRIRTVRNQTSIYWSKQGGNITLFWAAEQSLDEHMKQLLSLRIKKHCFSKLFPSGSKIHVGSFRKLSFLNSTSNSHSMAWHPLQTNRFPQFLITLFLASATR